MRRPRRTVASLLISTSYWDNMDELYCRVTNSAFDIDELVKVAPIMLARLYVNCKYPFGSPRAGRLSSRTAARNSLARGRNIV